MRRSLEVAEVFQAAKLTKKLSTDKLRVARKITSCRTAMLGGHVRKCSACSYYEQSYNSCRDRHCPKCQGSVAAKWVESRVEELLPVPYFHTVFTLPSELREVAYQNKREVYELLFQAVSETLQAVAANPRFLGAQIAFFSVLHTWNQLQEFHPHLHVVSPKGGISFDNTKWVSSKHNFFLPVRALSKVFRGKMIDALRQAHQQGRLRFYGHSKHLESKIEFERLLGKCRKSNWVVYSKKPFGGPTQVIKYFSSYVHRVAISNHRLRKLEDNNVTFSYRDSKNKNKKRLCLLPATTFVHRFLLHILPKNFTRIRHYGFLSNGHKARYLPLAKKLIAESKAQVAHPSILVTPFKHQCPSCKKGIMAVLYSYFTHRASYTRYKSYFFPLNFSPQASIIASTVA